jgi:Zn-dependent protease with chaperone function
MALPSGMIVVTDELIALARDDRELLGVLAHEAGHVERRHGIRLVLQHSALGLLAAWLVGDVTSLLAVAPATLLQAKYSRDFEREADSYAADLLRARGISPGMLADLLERLEQVQPGPSSTVLSYASSHPATEERLDALRGR